MLKSKNFKSTMHVLQKPHALQTHKAKIILSATAIVAVAVPTFAFAITQSFNFQGSRATEVDASNTMPAVFADQNFYDCVRQEFTVEFPGEEIPATGLTDAQLAKMTRMTCNNKGIANTAGLEKMTGLTSLSLVGNPLDRIDLSANALIANLQVDNITVRVDLHGDADNRVYDLKNLKFLGAASAEHTYSNTIPDTENYVFDETEKILSVNNLKGANGYAQVVSADAHATYKLQLPSVYTLAYDANGGSGAPIAQECASLDDNCFATVSSVMPTRKDFVFKGWATTPNATAAQYWPGSKVKLTDRQNATVLYAVWAENAKPTPTPTPTPTPEPSPEPTPEPSSSPDSSSAIHTASEAELAAASAAAFTGTVTWKQSQNHVQNSHENGVVVIGCAISEFESLFIDGKELAKDREYTAAAESTSTVLTISGETMDKLELGTHTLIANLSGGRVVTTTFSVVAAQDTNMPVAVAGKTAQTNPTSDSGDSNSNIVGIIVLCILIPVLGIALAVVGYKLFRNKEDKSFDYYTYEED